MKQVAMNESLDAVGVAEAVDDMPRKSGVAMPPREAGGKRRKGWRTAGKVVLALFVLLFGADLAWTGSGSNEWEAVSDSNGIRVASMKTPGYRLLKYKVEMVADARLSDVVFYLSDTGTGNDVGAKDVKRLEAVSSAQLSYVYDTYKLDLPAPFGQAEVVLINSQVQDPVTGKVRVNIFGAPNKLPRTPGLRRVEHLANSWTLTPLPDGGVAIESVSEFDLGLPYLLANAAMPGVIGQEFAKMRELLKLDKYKNKTLPHITEPGTERP